MGAQTRRRTRRQAKNDNATRASDKSVEAFLAAIDDDAKRSDAERVVALMKRATGEEPKLWGSIIGFGAYHYRYASGREGDFFLTGVAPRKVNLTLYIMPGFSDYGPLLDGLGKHKTAKSCLYITRLSDVDQGVLETLVARSVADMRRKYPE